MITTEVENKALAEAVISGFSAQEKSLPSWVFYDETGDKIFQKIMAMPEYYLTNSEFEIFETQHQAIYNHIAGNRPHFDLIELGAGDGLKTEILLKYFNQQPKEFNYRPVDISGSVLEQLQNRLKQSLPDLPIKMVEMEYFEALELFNKEQDTPLTVLFLGANIGNFPLSEGHDFLCKIADALKKGDQVLLGVDLKKDPDMILDAYNDAAGITNSFNMNVLKRLNKELGADFNLDNFKHYASYDPQSGTAKSFLVSKKDQEVTFSTLNRSFTFKPWELIHVEVSQKFDEQMIAELAHSCGMKIEKYFYDKKGYFADVLLRK